MRLDWRYTTLCYYGKLKRNELIAMSLAISIRHRRDESLTSRCSNNQTLNGLELQSGQ